MDSEGTFVECLDIQIETGKFNYSLGLRVSQRITRKEGPTVRPQSLNYTCLRFSGTKGKTHKERSCKGNNFRYMESARPCLLCNKNF